MQSWGMKKIILQFCFISVQQNNAAYDNPIVEVKKQAANAIEAQRMDSKRSKKKNANVLCAVDQIWICVLCLDDHISITRI